MVNPLQLVAHPDELLSLIHFKFFHKPLYPRNPASESEAINRCFELLQMTSRSFSMVIMELHPELRNTIMIFYIVLRALDTIEDDMTIDNEIKLPLLRRFGDILDEEEWSFEDSNEKDKIVLEEFTTVLQVYHQLKPEYQAVIKDITIKMGNGMAQYADRTPQQVLAGVSTIKDYDLYCHYVAGLVGEGLTKLAVLSQFGTPVLAEKPELAESMGLFLQKTNIIRDYREDLNDKRSFWPREVWAKYGRSLSEFVNPSIRSTNGLFCVADLVTLSLNHVTDVLEYLENVKEPSLFRFCAIPQVMSIATLELVFQNTEIFDKNVKLRKGQTVALIESASDMKGVYDVFSRCIKKIHKKNNELDPNYLNIEIACGKIEAYINKKERALKKQGEFEASDMVVMLTVGAICVVFIAAPLLMVGYLFGGNYGALFRDMKEVFWDGLPQDLDAFDARLASKALTAASSTATKVASTVASVATEAASAVHSEL